MMNRENTHLVDQGDVLAFDKQADAIIRKHMSFAMGGGAIPLPLFDLVAVTAVQLAMLKALAKHYSVPFDAGSARAFLTSLAGSLTGRVVARLGASAVKVIPGIGTVGGGVAQILLTGASTYAVGRLFQRLFRAGRPLEDLDFEVLKQEAERYVDAGRRHARSVLEGRRGKQNGGQE